MSNIPDIKGTILEILDVSFKEISKDRVVMTMPITRKTHQPHGLLHGGVSVVLAETSASAGAWMNIDQSCQAVVGMEINANHLRPKKEGLLTATAKPFYIGRSTSVWDVQITDEKGLLVCISRCTLAIIDVTRFNNEGDL
jgi:1,4-dihydroxy-2-naphthoyl-CoA hydrolase